MAKTGFVIGLSDDTSTPPTLYWDGAQTIEDVDYAMFVEDIAQARAEAGRVQQGYTENHVEAYPVTKAITHTPALGAGGI